MTKHTLLIRLAAPMQSWGSRSRFGERDTEREPTKSGLIGLLCAALGRERTASVDDLAALRFGVRVDREGTVERDYQTADAVRKADPKAGEDTVLSNRYYLADAVFLAGLESDSLPVLEAIDAALARPRWNLFLGRKAFVPAQPIRLPDGLRRGENLEAALSSYPFIAPPIRRLTREAEPTLRIVLECGPDEDGEIRPDVPISFDAHDRRFGARRVRTVFAGPPKETGEVECT